MSETDAQRNETARDLAYAQGKREAIVDGRLDSAERRLQAINGSIEKHARNADALRKSMDAKFDAVNEAVAEIAAIIKTNAAVEKDRVRNIKEANEKQISSRQFWIGVLTICAMLFGVFVAVIVKTHGG